MAKRGIPAHPDAATAREVVIRDVINPYKGRPVLSATNREFVQKVVIDAMCVAPQPVARDWARITLTAVNGLVQWAELTGEPVTRDHLFNERTRNRFNQTTRHLSPSTRANYRTRIDLVAMALAGTQLQSGAVPKVSKKSEPTHPLTPQEVATLWMWATGLRTLKQRQRTTGCMILGLGFGVDLKEVAAIQAHHITIDADGYHLTVPGPDSRVVTCDKDWEVRLQHLLNTLTSPEQLLAAPWRTTPVYFASISNALADVHNSSPSVARFSARSLRNTWLVNRITAGTPIPTLLNAAGLVSVASLDPLLPYVPAPTPAERAAQLRGN